MTTAALLQAVIRDISTLQDDGHPSQEPISLVQSKKLIGASVKQIMGTSWLSFKTDTYVDDGLINDTRQAPR